MFDAFISHKKTLRWRLNVPVKEKTRNKQVA